jgi:hypothetical protein
MGWKADIIEADTLFFQLKDIGDTLWQREPLKAIIRR